MGYNSDMDAHKVSNYNEIKNRINKITEVIVDLRGIVPPETIQILLTCLEKQQDFILFCNDSYVAFCPRYLISEQNGTTLKYEDTKQMINSIKLCLITHSEIYVTDFKVEDALKKQIE